MIFGSSDPPQYMSAKLMYDGHYVYFLDTVCKSTIMDLEKPRKVGGIFFGGHPA